MQKGADCPLLHLVCIYDYITVLRFCVGFLLELPSNFCGDFLLESSKVPTIALPPVRLQRKNDFEYPPLPGCGTQHPHRALGGTCVLLAAAPTTPPCFRHWRRSSSLHSGYFQRKDYFKFRVCRALRSAPNAIFTRGVVKRNGRCSAAFCESAALRGKAFAEFQRAEPSQSSLRDASSPEGGALSALTGRCVKAPPSGELARERLRGFAPRGELSRSD